jgi:hypothetical protein
VHRHSSAAAGVQSIKWRPAQAGTLYGLWGTLLVVYGIVFSSIIDLFGAESPCMPLGMDMPCLPHHACKALRIGSALAQGSAAA